MDLLDRMFELDENKRIDIAAIMQHPWYKAPMRPVYEDALEKLALEQEVVEKRVSGRRRRRCRRFWMVAARRFWMVAARRLLRQCCGARAKDRQDPRIRWCLNSGAAGASSPRLGACALAVVVRASRWRRARTAASSATPPSAT